MVKLRYKLDHERFSGSVRVWCAYKGWEEATAGSMRTQSWNLLFQRFLSKINILHPNIHVKVRLVLTILSVSKLAATGSRKVRKRPGSCESRKMNPESSVRQRYRLVLQWTTAATLHTAVWVNTHTQQCGWRVTSQTVQLLSEPQSSSGLDKWFQCTRCSCSAIKVLSAPSTCEVQTNINTILISWVSLSFTVKNNKLNKKWTCCPWRNIWSQNKSKYLSGNIFFFCFNFSSVNLYYTV